MFPHGLLQAHYRGTKYRFSTIRRHVDTTRVHHLLSPHKGVFRRLRAAIPLHKKQPAARAAFCTAAVMGIIAPQTGACQQKIQNVNDIHILDSKYTMSRRTTMSATSSEIKR